MKLSDYRKKRDASQTTEPFGAEPPREAFQTKGGAFVVHLHDATRRHYDLRLEIGGVLSSFAVPKGPSLDPDQKHLAVNTEDHPIEYLDFEAVIPEGNYGAGSMILWDRGHVRYLDGSAEEGVEKGKIDFVLTGYKLRGRFALVRLKGSTSEWLLFKKKDAFSSKERDLLSEEPRSILSGLTVDELASAPQLARDLEARAEALGAPPRKGAKRVSPMLCGTATADLSDPGWIYELKLDGVRIIAEKEGDRVTLTYRSGRDTTASYPEIVRAVRALSAPRVVLDGEIVTFDEGGRPSFQRLGQRIHLTRAADVRRAVFEVPVVYLVFDLLSLGDRDLSDLALLDRKKILAELLPGPGVLRVLDHIPGDGAALLAFCRDQHLEGIVAKRAASTYRPGPKRTNDWLKVKCERDDEFVIVGYTVGEGGRKRLGALDIASYDKGALTVRGKVGSGLDEATLDMLVGLLAPLEVPAPEAIGTFGSAPRGRTFVRPELCVSVRFLGWSEEAQVRFPVYRGLRPDVSPRDCTASPKAILNEAAIEPPRVIDEGGVGNLSGAREGSSGAPAVHKVSVTNRKKVFWPAEGITKGDLVAYYDAVSPVLLPYLLDRPVVLVRYPDGVEGKSFFQWNVPPGLPRWVRSIKLPPRSEDKHEKNVFLVNDPASLVYLANLACIPIHVLGCRAESLGMCDFLTIDFDLKGAPLSLAVELALTLRELLAAIGLPGYPKTSGQTGLHVLIPLGPSVPFEAARALVDLLGRLVVQRHPRTATMERIVSKRQGRILVDTGQTGPARTIVAPYSVRAAPGATVSTPLHWDEVTPALDPTRFSMATVPARIAELGDPMAAMLAERPNVGAAVQAIGELLGSGGKKR